LTRYKKGFFYVYSYYVTIFKVLYIAVTAGIIIGIKYSEPIKSIYNFEQDAFPHWKYCVAPCAVLALATAWFGHRQDALVLFSFYLEAVSILPQLVVLRRYRLVENLTGKYVFFLGAYRFFYVWHWIDTGTYKHDLPKFSAGVIQTLFYADFFYQYARASRCCGFATGECLGRPGLSACDRNNDDDYDDDDFVFELSASRDPKNDPGTSADAIEPLLLAPGGDEPEAIAM